MNRSEYYDRLVKQLAVYGLGTLFFIATLVGTLVIE